jgi:senataxin
MVLREMLSDLPEIQAISSIDGIQGKENDIIICSMVRVGNGVGFNYDVHRINVLLTRARLSLYIIGSMSTFQTDNTWKALIKDAKDRRLFDAQKFHA